MLSQITFRSDDVFTDRFGREVVETLAGRFTMWQRFEVERYLEYHGDKLARRFDANSYLLLTKAMDLHDIGRGRGGIESALARIAAPMLSVGISSDILYPAYQQRELCDGVVAQNGEAEYVELDSPHGHDAFLIERDQLFTPLTDFLARIEKSTTA
jgi:homoserine O-acetyltransferase